MPRATLPGAPGAATSAVTQPGERFRVWLIRLLLLLFTMLGSAYGVWEMQGVISAERSTPLQWVFLGLFALNFTWIVYALGQSLLGFIGIVTQRLRTVPHSTEPLQMRTALLIPVYNEDPQPIALALTAMAHDLAQKAPGAFDVFILSDTTRSSAWLQEEAVFRVAIQEAPKECRIYYRHRQDNRERKAGNIADWVSRWGNAYQAMTILDADSIMSAQTLIDLTRRLEASPETALIQTIPRIVFGASPFARLQQFANRCYGPIYANGLAAWHGKSSNYWGHNAVIRVRAFAESARLPELPGKPPFGGHILSHDFAEAAFLRRAGWGVRLATDLEETYEQSPPSLLDVIIRDRRWCQGNFQHGKLLFARGMHPCSRLHFATGILSYLTAPVWLLLVLTGLFLAAQVALSQPQYFAEPSLFPTWPIFDSERAIRLFIVSMGVVLMPKLLGWLAAMLSWKTLRAYGGPLVLSFNVLLETVLSALYAPIMMISQTGIVLAILAGRDAGWQPQRRADGVVPARDILRAHLWQTLTGIVLGAFALWISLPLFFWLLPITAGLVLSIPLSWMSGQRRLGRLFGRLQLLRTPEDKYPPPILETIRQASAAAMVTVGASDPRQHPIERLALDPELAAWHVAQLKDTSDAVPEEIDEDLLTALAKAERVSDVRRLAQWLTPAQTRALIGDLRYFRRFCDAPCPH